jgi:hypothetical protein
MLISVDSGQRECSIEVLSSAYRRWNEQARPAARRTHREPRIATVKRGHCAAFGVGCNNSELLPRKLASFSELR